MLHVHWLNATRTGLEKSAIEQLYHDELLKLCGNDLNALRLLHDDHYRLHQQPGTRWHQFNEAARALACATLTPTDRLGAAFQITIETLERELL